MIVVDSNEAAEAPTIAEILRTGAEVAVRQLEAGDYLLTGQFGSVLVERKRVPDFLSSLKGRLWDQLERIRSFRGDQGPDPRGERRLLQKGPDGTRRRSWR
jgi:ERCC4-type nuclease